jgi:hypothetical protein
VAVDKAAASHVSTSIVIILRIWQNTGMPCAAKLTG